MVRDDPQSGLEARLQRLLSANQAALRRMVASYARSLEDQKDLQQEIALAVWRSLPGFRGDCSEKTFLLRIAHNRCLTFLQSQKSSVSLEADPMDFQDRQPDAEDQALREEEKDGLLQAVRALPLIYREIVLLALEGLDYLEISEVVGISESNVGARLSRARQQLRQVLEVRREQRY
jgi:RNA polymerase sigma-70 factor (ECF subfamily)